ncbi:hypothetical protein N7457_009714 [Penicillium paradoxum]|uniref:uncharacterized protein n=1 Tax=Penicillium paradoxum TaxID=176176 RepID=UPI0025466270|nr:uncharacterized protein N7457_009714 [Penicillium paradoxum]KAJ5774818.1 hypothetical protein N7457_009714 [Penicillium paradoxum]
MAESPKPEFTTETPENLETDEFDSLLTEVTARCEKQTEEIRKWLLYTQDFQQRIASSLEHERRRQATERVVLPGTPMTPITPRTPRTLH